MPSLKPQAVQWLKDNKNQFCLFDELTLFFFSVDAEQFEDLSHSFDRFQGQERLIVKWTHRPSVTVTKIIITNSNTNVNLTVSHTNNRDYSEGFSTDHVYGEVYSIRIEYTRRWGWHWDGNLNLGKFEQYGKFVKINRTFKLMSLHNAKSRWRDTTITVSSKINFTSCFYWVSFLWSFHHPDWSFLSVSIYAGEYNLLLYVVFALNLKCNICDWEIQNLLVQ